MATRAPAAAAKPAGAKAKAKAAAAALDDDSTPWETLLKIRRCFAYQVPVTDGHISVQCESWGLEKPIFTGELHVLGKQQWLYIKLLAEGDTFADTVWLDCSTVGKPTPLEAFIDTARDSSRYFVIRVGDTPGPKPRRVVPMGIGFRERNQAFDLNAAIRDRIAQVQRGETPEQALKRAAMDDAKETAEAEARLAASMTDLSLKAGQRIKVNFKTSADDAADGDEEDDDGFGSFTSASSTIAPKKSAAPSIAMVASKGGGLMLAPPPDLEASLAELKRREGGEDDEEDEEDEAARKEKKKAKKKSKKKVEEEEADDFGDFTGA